MALLFCAQKSGYNLLVIHCMHDMRPLTESQKDRDLVRDYCKSHDLPFHEVNVFLKNKIQNPTEEAYRDCRYDTIKRIASLYRVSYVATGHHADDQIETMIMKLCRGSGLRGLSGISDRLVDDGLIYIRPMLDISKQDTYDICSFNKIPYNEDSTNKDVDYTRNAIRQKVLPVLKGLFPNCAQKSSDAARILSNAQDLAKRSCLDLAKYETVRDHSVSIPTAAMVLSNDITIYEWLRDAFSKVASKSYDSINKENVDKVVSTIRTKGSKKFDWPCKVKVVVNRNEVKLECKE